jgi:hypothetical protein
MQELNDILENIKQYVDANITNNKNWKPGQIINYAGPVYTSDEYVYI